jgi:predicted ribosomally synthesized peptide with SipW-like signal peptide
MTTDRNKNRKRLLALALAVALVVAGVFAAFTATTTNPDNKIESGTVAVGSDVSGAIYSLTGQKPTDVVTKCVRVTYTGTLAATVKAYVSSGITNGTLFNLKIERGTQTTGTRPDCGDFTPTATVKADGQIGSTATDYTNGYDIKGSAFAQNDNVTLRFTITTNDDTTPNGHTSVTSTGLHTWTFEARNN